MQENILSKKLSPGLNFSTPSGRVTSPLLKGFMNCIIYNNIIVYHTIYIYIYLYIYIYIVFTVYYTILLFHYYILLYSKTVKLCIRHIHYIVNEGKKTHPVLTEKLTLDRANIMFL